MQTIINKRYLLSNFLLLLYLAICLFQSFNSVLPSISIAMLEWRTIYKMFVIFWISIYFFQKTINQKMFVEFVRINLLLIFIYSFKQILFGFFSFERHIIENRIYSLYPNGAVFAVLLGIGACDLLLKYFKTGKFIFLLMMFFFLFISLFSLQRSPILASFISIFLLNIVAVKLAFNAHKKNWLKIISSFFIGFLFICLLFSFPPSKRIVYYKEKMVIRFLDFMNQGAKEESLATRVDQIPDVIRALKQYPLGGGLGYTSLRWGDRFDDESYFKGIQNQSVKISLPMGTGDNSFLDAFINLGIPGGIIFIVMLFASYLMSFILCLQLKINLYSYYSLGVMTIILISITTSSIFHMLIIGTLFWVFVALGLVQEGTSNKTKELIYA